MVTALTIIPVLGLLGGSIDVVRLTTRSAEMRSAVDSAVLAAANLSSAADVAGIIEQYLDASFADDPAFLNTINVTIDADVALNSRVVGLTAAGEIDTIFLRLFGINTLPVVAQGSAAQSITNIELSLVMDISSSMAGSRIAALRPAAVEFVNQILTPTSTPTTSISLVPFGGSVNLGPLFDTLAAPLASAVVDPSESDYDIGDDVLTTDFRFTNGDNCIELEQSDFGPGLIPDGSRGQVPHFWRWNNFNPWCPGPASQVLFQTNVVGDLEDVINGMTLSDGTGMDIGAAWGLKALSPAWRGELGGAMFTDRPADFSADDTLKVLVIMTDGAITEQSRPEDFTLLNTHTNRPTNNAPNIGSVGDQGNNNNSQTVVDRGGQSAPATADNAVGHFRAVCEAAATNNVVIFTIGFQISPGSLSDVLLQDCATPTGGYFLVETLDIATAFNSIAASVNTLRIVG